MAKKNGTIVGGMSLDSDWQTEDDLRTLAKASQIKADPKRYKKAMKLAQDQIEALEDLDPVADAKEDKKEGEKDD
jgi:hypothetical protein